MHHARNARYIDGNFGGSLVLWDELFGTYQPEDEAPIYGGTHPPPARSTIAPSVGGLPELAADLRAAGGVHPSVRPMPYRANVGGARTTPVSAGNARGPIGSWA